MPTLFPQSQASVIVLYLPQWRVVGQVHRIRSDSSIRVPNPRYILRRGPWNAWTKQSPEKHLSSVVSKSDWRKSLTPTTRTKMATCSWRSSSAFVKKVRWRGCLTLRPRTDRPNLVVTAWQSKYWAATISASDLTFTASSPNPTQFFQDTVVQSTWAKTLTENEKLKQLWIGRYIRVSTHGNLTVVPC